MISEKARAFAGRSIYENQCTGKPIMDIDDVYELIEIAEREIEGRMKAKAIEAYKSVCLFPKHCVFLKEHGECCCDEYNDFVEELNA